MEMLYSHLARDPPKLSAVATSISSCLSEIIYKMMAKPPDDRYQSADGIIKDLEHCKSCFLSNEHNKAHKNFVPGRYDVSSVFKIPLKLYGREKEHAKLLECIEYAKTQEVTGCHDNANDRLIPHSM
jgi:serine/threonine protein kinase